MARFTQGEKGTHYLPESALTRGKNGFYGEAIEKLARFEDICDRLTAEQNHIAEQLEELRRQGKTSSVKFRELMTKKLLNVNMLSIFEVNGLA